MSMTNEKLLELADQLDRATGMYLLGKERVQLGIGKTHELADLVRHVVNMRVNPIVKIIKPDDTLAP